MPALCGEQFGYFNSAELAEVESQTFADALSIGRIGFVEVRHLQLLNMPGRLSQAADNVADEALLRILGHEAEQVAGLGVVVALVAMIVAVYRAADHPGAFTIGCILRWTAKTVGLIVR